MQHQWRQSAFRISAADVLAIWWMQLLCIIFLSSNALFDKHFVLHGLMAEKSNRSE